LYVGAPNRDIAVRIARDRYKVGSFLADICGDIKATRPDSELSGRRGAQGGKSKKPRAPKEQKQSRMRRMKMGGGDMSKIIGFCAVCHAPIFKQGTFYNGHHVHAACKTRLMHQNADDPKTLRHFLQRNRP
jgi:hypothetical protein